MAKLVTYTFGDKFDFFRTTGTLTTSNTTETVLLSVLIPGGSMSSTGTNTIFRIEAGVAKTNSNGTALCKFYVNTSATLASALQLATYTISTTQRTIMFSRFGAIASSNSTVFFGTTTSNSSDYFGQAGAGSSINIDWTVDQYIILAGRVVNALDTIGGFYLKVSN